MARRRSTSGSEKKAGRPALTVFLVMTHADGAIFWAPKAYQVMVSERRPSVAVKRGIGACDGRFRELSLR